MDKGPHVTVEGRIPPRPRQESTVNKHERTSTCLDAWPPEDCQTLRNLYLIVIDKGHSAHKPLGGTSLGQEAIHSERWRLQTEILQGILS